MRTRNLFDPASDKPFKLSRSKIDLFLKCPRCFYLDRRLGISRPSGPAFSLNSAVDALLKKEFDSFRAKGEPHPIMKSLPFHAVPFAHDKMDEWRENFKGVTFVHQATNLLITGAVDDIWVTQPHGGTGETGDGELIIVDYKSTSKDGEVELTDAFYHDAYRRQMEVYQWLLRRNGFTVSDTGYFVYCNGLKDKDMFDNNLEFAVKLIDYTGSDSWVEPTLTAVHHCLRGEELPASAEGCEYCLYRNEAHEAERAVIRRTLPPLVGTVNSTTGVG